MVQMENKKQLDQMEQIGVKAHGLRTRAPCQGPATSCRRWADRFPPIGDNIDEFLKEWNNKKLSIQGNLQDIIPQIRNGTGGEVELSNLLND